MFEFRHKIPSGQGQWVNVDLKPLFLTETTQFPADKSQTQDIFIQGVEPWMQPLVVTSDNNSKKSLVNILLYLLLLHATHIVSSF